jgi:hypothetical protein
MADFEFPPEEIIQPVQQVVPVQEGQPPVQDLPITFCVKTRMNGRNGYYLMRWSHGGLDPNGKIIHVIKPGKHYNRYYRIDTMARTMQWREVVSKKSSGNITRTFNWMFTNQRLIHDDERIPVITITPISTSLPSMPTTSFIPITDPVLPQQFVEIPQLNLPVNLPKEYEIKTIPQHVIMALLRDAAMQEEVCPITSHEIDVTNGAVTSCFHLFEKDAIMRWLLMPNSRDKCPVCNTPCNSFTLTEQTRGPPPLDMSAN